MSQISYRSIPRFTDSGTYRVNIPWCELEKWLSRNQEEFEDRFEMDPDFQRSHVWTEVQQRRYVEYILREGQSSRIIYWNCVGWMRTFQGPMVLVDGKQRITAVLKFLNNELPIFDGHYRKDFKEPDPPFSGPDFVMHVNNLPTRAQVLQWYLDLNEGGTVHTESELSHVRELLAAEPTP